MRAGGMLREAVIASAVLAVLVATVAGLLGHVSVGLGIAAGLLLGSLNGYAIVALFGRDTSFVAGSMLRLATFTALGLLVAMVLGLSPWPVMVGVGAAQSVMVATGIRHGLRA